jgi:hypothetical protein
LGLERHASLRNLESRMHMLDGTIQEMELGEPTNTTSSIPKVEQTVERTVIMETVSSDSQESAVHSNDTTTTLRSHRSFSFIDRKSLYNLAVGMDDLENTIDHIREDTGEIPNKSKRDSLAFSRTFSDEALDDLQNALALADQAYDDTLDSTLNTTTDLSLSPRTAKFVLNRLESADFQPPSLQRQEQSQHNTLSLSESMQGLQEEIAEADRMQTTSRSAFRQTEEVLALVQEENRVLKTEMDSLRGNRKQLDVRHEEALNEIREKVVSLTKELSENQAQHCTEVRRGQQERSLLEKDLADRQEKLQNLESRHQEELRSQEARHDQLERELANAKEEGESIKSVYSNMIQMHLRENGGLHKQIKELQASHSLEKTRFEQEIESLERRVSLQKETMEELEAQHEAYTTVQQEKKGAKEQQRVELKAKYLRDSAHAQREHEALSKRIGMQQEIIDKLKDQRTKDLQDLEANRELPMVHARQEKEALAKKLESQGEASQRLESQYKVDLDVEHKKASAAEKRLKDLQKSHGAQARQSEEEKRSLAQKISLQLEAIEQLETQHKNALGAQREKAQNLEKLLIELKLSQGQQLRQVKQENESLQRDLAALQETVELTRVQHQKEISALQEEKQAIENQMKELVATNDPGIDQVSLALKLTSQEEAIKRLGAQHQDELNAQEAKKHTLLQQMNDLKAAYEGKIGESEKQKEMLMRTFIRQQEAIKQMETQHEKDATEQNEQKLSLEKQLNCMREDGERIKEEGTKVLQTQKEKSTNVTLQLNEMKAMRKIEANSAQQECQSLAQKLADRQTKLEQLEAQQNESLKAQQEKHRSLTKQLEDMHSAYDKIKSDYANFAAAMEESGTLSEKEAKESYVNRDLGLQNSNDSESLKTDESRSTNGVGWPIAILFLVLLGVFYYFFATRCILTNNEDRALLRSQVERLRDEKIELESKVLHTERALVKLKSNLSDSKEESLSQHADKLDSEMLLLRSERDEYSASFRQNCIQSNQGDAEVQPLGGELQSSKSSSISDLQKQLMEARQENARSKQALQTTGMELSLLESGRTEMEKRLKDADYSFETVENQFLLSQQESRQMKQLLLSIENKAKTLELEKANVESQLVHAEKMLSKAQLEVPNRRQRIVMLQAFQKQLNRGASFVRRVASQQLYYLIQVCQRLHAEAAGKLARIKTGTLAMLQLTKRKISNVVRSDRGKIQSEEGTWLLLL